MTTSTFTAPTVAGLNAYTGTFDRTRAAHLLRRCTVGPTLAEIDAAVDRGLQATLDLLLAPAAPPGPPVNTIYDGDPRVPIGATWIKSRHLPDGASSEYRWKSLRGWYHYDLIRSRMDIREMMTLFWINHFGMADVGEHRSQFKYIQLFRSYATGNFRELIEKITVHPSMLAFLNGRYNNKWAPDENYARELLELFTVQKGKPGDVNYTEEDIREIARVLTGWRVEGHWSREVDIVKSYFDPEWHDTESKQLSEHFGNAVIENQGGQEYKTLIDIIFRHKETARAIVRDLYTFFVDHRIDDDVEYGAIRPLARLLVDNDFELRPVLRNLLESNRFFATKVRGTMVKSPYIFMTSMARSLGGYGYLKLDQADRYHLGNSFHWWGNNMGMDFLYLPTVSGWKAYYQSPAYYRSWITAANLQQRRKFVDGMCGSGIWANGESRPVDWFRFIASLTNPEDPNALIRDVIDLFIAAPLHPDQVKALKESLLPAGLEDFEWTIQYRQYLANKNNYEEYGRPVYNKIRDLFRALFNMAEFHLH